ncbi:MAG TPA: PilZ domain-containing protein [Candidatus Omnitrophota bacterium]|nr:PilZ domain-containing protein [Candidatus Omnitrophota bacterium]
MEEQFKERRSFSRYPVNLPLKFFSMYYGQGQAKDISPIGLGMVTNEELKRKEHLEIWIQVPGDGPLYTKGYVVWSRKNELNQYELGIVLDDIDLVAMSRLIKKVEEHERPTL